MLQQLVQLQAIFQLVVREDFNFEVNTKLFIEAGAAGIHFEDQKPGNNIILGVTNTSVNSLYDTLVKAKTSGCSDMDRVSKDWTPRAGLKTFGNAVLGKIEKLNASDWKKETMKQQWLSHDPNTLSNAQARRVADSIFGQKGSVR